MKGSDTKREWFRRNYQERGKYQRKVREVMHKAREQGVCFRLYEYAADMYEIRVVGEQGRLWGVPLRRLPVILHGLLLMGETLRARRMSHEWGTVQSE